MEIPLKFAWSSLIYLLIGGTVGFIVLIDRTMGLGLERYSLTFSHVHILLIGFVSMMIFGVGYHLLPVFAGTELYSLRLAELQFWVQNIGLVGLTLTYAYRFAGSSYQMGALMFGAISLIGFYLFVYNVGRSLIPPEEA
ncbi:Cytochrome C and Quinol oxidase polypeptide I [Candidatus Methanoperedens nitroreducens]|uniref:Cytochrome C and Quinol oxidase polypeptide I n=1 Tax=Candidatus Methanoperedens nitratireducens TaxID=1392998 RepID=A0A062V3J5_9EURY|nr:cbb3-type cytochrome c oxidase subunit I [Candidatus Methanoperedens nitroreducens]KCZ70389.1 Cytochrome C and Quinol oxidase polypeptide I [Candidatus Methanoperedens nitroreducens]MDJ1420829.1 cbb3-type cytochrome c oxidase subunit I [Candidatus Methanoperedens sp.]